MNYRHKPDLGKNASFSLEAIYRFESTGNKHEATPISRWLLGNDPNICRMHICNYSISDGDRSSDIVTGHQTWDGR